MFGVFTREKPVEVPVQLNSVKEFLKLTPQDDFLFDGERFLDPQILVQANKAQVVGLPVLVLEDDSQESDSEESLSLGNSEGSPEMSAKLVDLGEVVLGPVDPDCALDDEIVSAFAPAKLFIGTTNLLQTKPFVHTAISINFS